MKRGWYLEEPEARPERLRRDGRTFGWTLFFAVIFFLLFAMTSPKREDLLALVFLSAFIVGVPWLRYAVRQIVQEEAGGFANLALHTYWDAVQEYRGLLHQEWKVKKHHQEKYGMYPDLGEWQGEYNLDIDWVDKDFPRNYYFRQRVDYLRNCIESLEVKAERYCREHVIPY